MTAARIRNRVEVDEAGCWIWQGSISPNGYGRISIGRETGYAHRYAYETFVGPIPDGLTIDHLCRVRACCNPDHLEAVTQKVNNWRAPGWNGNKSQCPRGHLYDEANTYIIPSIGRRTCRTCNRLRSAAFRARRAA